ncbi:MAG: class I SAM-dependent methyltransferase [Dehalococcoidia bacterium]
MPSPADFVELLVGRKPDHLDPISEAELARGRRTGPLMGRKLQVLVRATRAYYILELGAALGFTGLRMLSSLGSTGRLDTIESDPAFAKEAEANFANNGFADRTRVHAASPERVVPGLNGPYDLIVLHAPIATLTTLYEDLVRLLRTGGSLFFSNLTDANAEAAAGAEGPGLAFLNRLEADDRIALHISRDMDDALATRIR